MKQLLIRGVIALLAIAFAVVAYVMARSEARISRIWDVPEPPLLVSSDSAAIAHGRHLAVSRGCTECHASDLGGAVMSDDGFMGYLASANLTAGKGGVLPQLTDAQIARTLRHGIRHDGRSVIVMPAVDYFPLSDEDIGALIAYLRTVPPVDRELAAPRLGPGARALIVLAGEPLLSAEQIDHQAVRSPKPEAAVSVEYGRYVAAVCMSCHGENYAGGLVNGPPGTPASANLTPAGALATWDEAQFLAALRTGVLPDGRQMDARVMPWMAFAEFDDTEARAIWAFLQTVPPVAAR